MRTKSLFVGLVLAAAALTQTASVAEARPFGRGGYHGGYHGGYGYQGGYGHRGYGYGYRRGGGGGAIAAGILGGLLVGGLAAGLASDAYAAPAYGYGGYGPTPVIDPGPGLYNPCRTVARYGYDAWGNYVRQTATRCY